MNNEELKSFMVEMAREAGKVALEMFGNHGKIEIKAHDLDLVTEADKKVNDLIVNRIRSKFPDHGIISEEMGEENSNLENIWIIDPIDGTLNYSRKIPLFVVLITFRHKDIVQLCCVYDPTHNDMYIAEQGKGAWLNDTPIHCSQNTELDLSLGITNDSLAGPRIKFLLNLQKNVSSSNKLWASAYGATGINCAFVADGRRDWYLCRGNGGLWDYAGTILLLRESGCIVTDLNGNDWEYGMGEFLAANPQLHTKLLPLLQ